MKFQQLAGVVSATTIMFGVFAVAPASAVNDIKGFGAQETLKNFVTLGDYSDEIGYTVKTLVPSTDAVPYPVAGRLWEATVTTDSLRGTVTPVIPNFNARTPSGADYRVLSVSTPQGLNGGPLPEGASTTGKLYFDVVGENPDSVIYNNGSEDLLGWVNPSAPPPVTGGSSSGGGSSSVEGSTDGGGTGVSGSTGADKATPPSISNGVDNGPYGPSGSTPPVGN